MKMKRWICRRLGYQWDDVVDGALGGPPIYFTAALLVLIALAACAWMFG